MPVDENGLGCCRDYLHRANNAAERMQRLIEDLTDVAMPETMPRQEGNQMHTILAQRSGKKPAAKKEAETKDSVQ